MRLVCFCSLIVLASMVCAGDDIEFGKVRTDLQLVQEVTRFRQRIKLSGTTVKQDSQWANAVKEFDETFFAFQLQVDGKVSDVSWTDGWVRIVFETKSDFNSKELKLANLVLRSSVSFRVPRSEVTEIKIGEPIRVLADVFWQRGVGLNSVGPGRGLLPVGFMSQFHAAEKNRTHLNGCFVSNHYVATVHKQEFVFDKMEYVRAQGGQSGPQPGIRLAD